MKFLAFSLAAFLIFLFIAPGTASAQIGGRRRGTSSEIAVPLPVPPPELETVGSPDDGSVYKCLSDDEQAAAENSMPSVAVEVGEVFSSREVTTKAVVTDSPRPGYTEEARLNGTRGRILVELVLGSDGKVPTVKMLRGLPDGLNLKAVEAACQVKFTPATKDGRAVSQHVRLEYGFHLDDDPRLDPRLSPTRRPPGVPLPRPRSRFPL